MTLNPVVDSSGRRFSHTISRFGQVDEEERVVHVHVASGGRLSGIKKHMSATRLQAGLLTSGRPPLISHGGGRAKLSGPSRSDDQEGRA